MFNNWQTTPQVVLVATLFSFLMTASIHAQVDVLTNRYRGSRTGANLAETTLTTANVNVNQFGKLYSYPVNGSVYAQPLYVTNVTVAGVRRNVLYVATMNDKVYAFDADSSSPRPLWMRDFTSPPAVTPVPITDIVGADLNIVGNVGIQSTPVINRGSGTIYFVARTKENGAYVQRLHALDITTGASKPGSPVKISAAVAGTAPDATVGTNGKVVTFNSKLQSQRAGLALANGVVLIGWGSHEDTLPFHGWIMGYDATSLARVGVLCVTPDGSGGGVWQGGRAPTIDAAGDVYFATGDGNWNGTRNFADSLLKLRVSPSGFSRVDYFTPSNQDALRRDDDDLSGSGFTLLPESNLLLGGGKEGVLYLLNPLDLRQFQSDDRQVIQKLPVQGGHVMGGPVYWKSAETGPLVYNWSEDDVLKSYRFRSGRLDEVPYSQGGVASPGHPGGSLTISANGGTYGTGIVWASMPTSRDGIHGTVAGILRAYDAETLRQLWTSEQNAARDRAGTLMKFVPPIVVGGKVFMPNHDGSVAVYGLLPSAASDFSLGVGPASRIIAPGGSGTFTVTVRSIGEFAGVVSFKTSIQPAAATVSFAPSSVTGAGTSTMTVSVPSTASGSFSVTATGTSAGVVHSAAPVDVIVVPPGAMGINFVGSGALPMAASERAGVVVQQNWNNAAGAAASTPRTLIDASGASTGATVTWSSAAVWTMPIGDEAGNRRMMKGYLDTTSSSTTTVTVAGLRSRAYNVYVYVDGDNRTYDRSAAYTIAGPGITTATVTLTDRASTNFSTTFTRAENSAGNFVRFRITGAEFTISAVPTAPVSGTRRAPVNGVQIVPVAPAEVAIGVNFLGRTTTSMASAESAGVVSTTRWNNAAGAARSTPLPLTDASGTRTSATVTWNAYAAWSTPTVDAPGNARLMKGYLDTSNTSVTTITVVGLMPKTYDVYVYVDGENREFERTGSYRISGADIAATTVTATDAANANFSGLFMRADGGRGNYMKFTITARGFTLTATPLSATGTYLRAPVNAIQIVPR
jgi:hypothetical protein